MHVAQMDSAWVFVLNAFKSVLETLDSFVFNFAGLQFSALDFSLGIIIIGAICPIVIVTVKNWSNSTVNSEKVKHNNRGDKS